MQTLSFKNAKLGLFFALGLFLLLNTVHVSAATVTVKKDGTGDYTGIQSAINASAKGDTIMVYSGRYDEAIILKDSQTLIGSGFPVVTNSVGNAITLANYNEVTGLCIENPGRHGILGVNVTGANIHNNRITGFNKLKETQSTRMRSRLRKTVGFDAIQLDATGSTTTDNKIRKNVITGGVSGGICILAFGKSNSRLLIEGNVISNLNGNNVHTGWGNYGVRAVGRDDAIVNIVISDTSLNNIGTGNSGWANNSEGVTIEALNRCTMNVHIQSYSYQDEKGMGGPISNGVVIVVASPEVSVTCQMENSNISDAGIGFEIFSKLPEAKTLIIDLGGGNLESVGNNRFINNQRNILIKVGEVIAKNNWWGTIDPNIIKSKASGSFIFEPFLKEDPRPKQK